MILDALTAVSLLVAAFFFFAGMLGIARFPDTLCRLHSVTKADNLGLGFIVLGLALQADSVWSIAKLGVIWGLALTASAASSFLVASRAVGGETSREDEPKEVRG